MATVAIEQPETTLEAICEAIGYGNTRVLQAWYAGRNLYVPTMAREDHPLARLISFSSLKQLVAGYAANIVFIPSPAEDYRYFLERQMAHQIAHGASDDDLVELHGLTAMRVHQLRNSLGEKGWIQYAMAMPEPRPHRGRNNGIERRLSRNF